MSVVCCAAAWSPKLKGPYAPADGIELPFTLRTGALREEVWARWIAADPLTLVGDPRCADALSKLSLLFIDAGVRDEYALQLGARQLSDRLTKAGIAHVHEEFPGGHRNTTHRYERSLALMTGALSA